MNIIQLVLIVGCVLCLTIYFGFYRSLLRDRLLALSLFALAVLAIVAPDLTTRVANLVGVGRGADLLIYTLFVATVFSFVLVYTRLAKVEGANTRLVRALAILTARRPEKS